MPARTPWRLNADGAIEDADGQMVVMGDRVLGVKKEGPITEAADIEDLVRIVLSVNALANETERQLMTRNVRRQNQPVPEVERRFGVHLRTGVK